MRRRTPPNPRKRPTNWQGEYNHYCPCPYHYPYYYDWEWDYEDNNDYNWDENYIPYEEIAKQAFKRGYAKGLAKASEGDNK